MAQQPTDFLPKIDRAREEEEKEEERREKDKSSLIFQKSVRNFAFGAAQAIKSCLNGQFRPIADR